MAVTGIGAISVLGSTLLEISDSLKNGRSGIVIDNTRAKLGFESPLTGKIKDFDPKDWLGRKQRKTMPDYAVQAYAASRQALDQSGLSERDLQSDETGLIFGCDSSCIAALEQVDLLKKRGETALIGSGAVFRSMTSCITMNLNALFKTRGAAWTISSACSSGGHAVGQAFNLIASGQQERVICGGAQEINWQSMCSFDGLGAFSSNIAHPAQASRPFDEKRDGLVPSGGAAAIVLERYELAEARGADILGTIAGYGFSSDGGHISVPGKNGLARAGAKAIKQADLSVADIDYICAHATATPAGDAAEIENIRTLFKGSNPNISSTKSMTGHELWMSGASQVVYTVLMNMGGFTAPNINFAAGSDETKGLKIIPETVYEPPRNALLNSAGFGGTNSCLILKF
ncbi:beta-ketoacyl-[acyl-carrier-protein] synthase family protein [Maridesulfovibrio hydrothermalis]|uniref:beta-ketoacyl-[acyl-carrier-protein] synthase family protein n=1 Tax=Maridesulfovibrio hydrothermalis TaxID=191026 RepID=UPI001FE2377D|nr:beta-ketoacyl-[acyl-carrier-protein] synthase family protein [Maridesulfovibrio hydrothermalis]